jgi:uncharacterized Zn-finger protein
MSQEKENQFQIEFVDIYTDKVMCDGGDGDLGHPAVYFKIKKNKKLFVITAIRNLLKKIKVVALYLFP